MEEGRTDHHTLRGLLTGTPDGGTAIAAVAWCAGLDAGRRRGLLHC